jgi:hypothetical protein
MEQCIQSATPTAAGEARDSPNAVRPAAAEAARQRRALGQTEKSCRGRVHRVDFGWANPASVAAGISN